MWLLLALVSAIATATRDPIYKKLLTGEVNPYVMGGAQFLLAGVMLMIVPLVQGFPPLPPIFFIAVAVTVILNVVAVVLHFKAIKQGDISMVTPLLSFLPAFAILTSFLMFGELPTWWGVIGILIIIVGSYILHSNSFGEGFASVMHRMLRSRTSLSMLVVAGIFSVSANFDKLAALSGTPVFASAIIDLILGTALIALSPLGKGERAFSFGALASTLPWLFVLAGLFALSQWAQNTAFTLETVPYVSAVIRTSAILTVFYGAYFFGEGHFRWRLAGAFVMLFGVLLLAF